MRRLLFHFFVILSLYGLATPALAESYLLKGTGWQLPLDGKNVPRGNNQLILYTADYGTSTKTNAWGVEILALLVADATGAGNDYKVQNIRSVWDCVKPVSTTASTTPASTEVASQGCGNLPLPAGAIVLSASGSKRKLLMDLLKPSVEFELMMQFFDMASTPFSVMNPSAENNPTAVTFPGFRGANQLLVYNKKYGKKTTGTNEFGYEVTVSKNRVTATEGSNSKIPSNGFVLSGHGVQRDWLAKNAPLGALVSVEEASLKLTSTIDFETYERQLKQKLKTLPKATPKQDKQRAKNALKEAQKFYHAKQPETAASVLIEAIKQLEASQWKNQARFPATAIKATWHRPLENSRQAVQATLDSFQLAGLNTVFLETFFHGYPLFPSTTFAKYGLPATQYPIKGLPSTANPMLWWVEEAHLRGMKVHAWMEVFYAGNQAIEGVGPILSKYPQWANVRRDAVGAKTPMPSTLEAGYYFLDPANPEVQKFILALTQELVTTYAVEGVQLDYIRYPATNSIEHPQFVESTWGYSPTAIAAFQAQSGVSPLALTPTDPQWESWKQFKQDQVNTMVSTVSTWVKGYKQTHPERANLLLSAAIFPDVKAALTYKHQNWGYWAAEGWVDFLAHMSLTASVNAVGQDVKTVKNAALRQSFPVISGVFSPFFGATPIRTLEQLESARKAGSNGYALFDSAHLSPPLLEGLHVWQTETPENQP
jgi:uncharacterized lipoprotein YddW (UPF0748 family)